MNKKVQSLVLAGIISANTLVPIGQVFADEIKTRTELQTNSIEATERQIYLSNIDYESDSNVGWGEIRKDTNVEGNGPIKLIVEGEPVEFGKGMGAHANSTLIYDVSGYSDTYNRLVSYIGVDASRGSNGNGVRFTISTSEDGQTWKEVLRSEVLKGDMESQYIDIDLNGANYIKLHANSNGNNAADHSVYADLKLVKNDYTPSSGEITGLEKVETYDNILRSNTVEDNISNNEMVILKRAFVKKLGYGTLKRMADQDQKYANALNYLMTDNTALKYFMTGGPVSIHGSYMQSFKCFSDIYAKYETQLKDGRDDNFNLRLAISIALSHGYIALPTSWLDRKRKADAVERYEVYQELIRSGRMDAGGATTSSANNYKWSSAQFKALPIPMMRWTVDNRINNDEILWLADYAIKEKEAGRNHFDAYNYIEYTSGYNYDKDYLYDNANYQEFEDKYGFSKYYKDYGNRDINRMWMVFEEGAVCGGLAQTYSNLADTFGRPSSPCGQPGHAASLTYVWNSNNQRYEWIIQNNISGWTQTGNQYDERMLGWGNQSWTIWHSASYTVLATDAVLDKVNYEKAAILNLLADSYNDNNMKKSCYEKALEHQAINLDSMEGLINCYKADESKTSNDYFELAKKIIETYTYYPQTMMELLALIENKITDPNQVAEIDMLKYDALVKSSNATPDVCSNVEMNKHMSAKYLGNESMELASFSFDGENANKIVINEKYNGSSIRVRYSLDGGTTWKQTDEHIIELTDEELASITANNDIIVGLVGTENTYTIDILEGKSISNSTLYKNDLENLLIGDVENLEFSTDGGLTWCNYVGGLENGMRFEERVTIIVRYKAHEQYLTGNPRVYTFTEDTDTDERKYIQLKNVTLEDFTSEESTGNDHAAVNFIDGNPNSAWHTAYRYEENKFYTVSFDKERYITALEYLPGNGANGRLRSGQILTSLDGETWEVSGTFTDIGNNTNLKNLPLDNPTKAKYVKLVATETYGNSTGEQNKYFSGKDITFYEDTTVVEDEPTIEPEVPEDGGTNVNPENPNPTPDEGFDSDTDVNPDIDQGGTDTPTVPPNDAPVEDIKPDIPPTDEIVKPDNEGWIKTDTLAQMHGLWDYTFDEGNQIIVLDKFKGINTQRNTDVKVEIPRTIEGYKVALANLNNSVFPGVTHIRVAEGSEEFVKVIATDLKFGFRDNKTLKYVDLEGLDVSEVINMTELFRNCSNLKVIKLTDWVVRNTTSTAGMFYMDKASSDEDKKILVITNSDKLDDYDFRASNRIPCIVTFSGNGGHFLGDEEILNMKIPRFTIRPEILEELDKVIEGDIESAGVPKREGYEFKGWYTDDKTPTNAYELLNMTYKARWEEVPEQQPPVENEGDIVPPADEEQNPQEPPVNEDDTTLPPTEDSEGNTELPPAVEPEMPDEPEVKPEEPSTPEQPPIDNKPSVDVDTPIEDEIIVPELPGETPDNDIPNLPNDNEGTPGEDIKLDIEVENENNGNGKAHVIRVNTRQGLDKVLDWLNNHMSYDREKEVVVDIDENTITYTINVFHHDKTVSYIKIKVSNDDKELIEILEQINTVLPPSEPEIPDSDFDSDMEVNPEEDFVVDDTPTTLPDDLDNGTNVNPDDVPADDQIETPDTNLENDMEVTPEDKPEISIPEKPDFSHDVVEFNKGEGNMNNPYELIVKEVTLKDFNIFLKELKSINTTVISVSEEDGFTLYKIKFNKAKTVESSQYAVIKVANSKTEIISALNEFAKATYQELNETIKNEEVLDGTSNDDMMVTPEVNNEDNTENNTTTDTPKTGDVGIIGYAGLGLASVIGVFKNRRKRK